MATLSFERIIELLKPFTPLGTVGEVIDNKSLTENVAVYLELLMRWNARTNLTSIREPEEIVRRHFGESLFTGQMLRGRLAENATILDFGSGAGFPGLPMQLLQPAWRVTLAESQGKKAAFLREAVRSLGVPTEVWGNRVEAMPQGNVFDCVVMRAVDNMDAAVKAAAIRVMLGGTMAILAGVEPPASLPAWSGEVIKVPESDNRYLHLLVAPI